MEICFRLSHPLQTVQSFYEIISKRWSFIDSLWSCCHLTLYWCRNLYPILCVTDLHTSSISYLLLSWQWLIKRVIFFVSICAVTLSKYLVSVLPTYKRLLPTFKQMRATGSRLSLCLPCRWERTEASNLLWEHYRIIIREREKSEQLQLRHVPQSES